MSTADSAPGSSVSPSYWSRVSELLSKPSFRWFWLGSSTQAIGQATQFLVIGWLVLEITGSSTELGLVIFLYGVPNVTFLLIAGIVADRFDRRYVLMITQAGVGLIISVLAVLTLLNTVSIWHIYVAAALLGIVQSLNMPARMTMVSDLVEPRSILDAVALQNAAVHAGRMVGPPIAGAIIEVWSLSASLFVIAVCYAVSIVCVAKIGRTTQAAKAASGSVFRNFADGISYIKNNPVVLTAIVITCSFGGFGMSHQQVIPAMAKEVLGVGAAGVGLLFLASGIGSFLGNFLLPIIGSTKVYRSLLINLVLFAVFLSFFSWSSWFWVSWIFFLLVGLVGLGSVWPLATSLIQLESPADMKGRVMGILQFTPGFHYLGAYPLALAAGQFGWGVAMTATAVATLLVTIWFGVIRSGAPAINIQINKENSAN